MKTNENNNIVSRNAKGEFAPIPKDNVISMNSILDSLRHANKDKKMWDKLGDKSLEDKGYNDWYPKDSK